MTVSPARSVALSSIHVYGEPSEKAMQQLHDKAQLLGTGRVIAQRLHAGFSRFGPG